MPSNRRTIVPKTSLLLILGLLAASNDLLAQKETTPPPPVQATRAELEAIDAHPPKGMSSADRAAVQSRLANGDFVVGDKVADRGGGRHDPTATRSPSAASGTLLLPSLPPLSLDGVLRSESDSVISEFLGTLHPGPQTSP